MSNNNKPVLILDAGHGGRDPGGGSTQQWYEKDKALKITLYQYRRFKQLGVPVLLTRDRDITLDPTPRATMVRNSGATYCFSNHINAGGGDGAEFIHSIYSDSSFSKALAEEIKKEGQNIRRIFTRTLDNNPRVDYYYMNRETGSVNTIIIEYGFADSKLDDIEQLNEKWEDYAEAIVRGYCKLTGFAYAPPMELSDIKGHWAEDSICKVYEMGLMTGYKDGTFKPDDKVSRAELAVILDRLSQ